MASRNLNRWNISDALDMYGIQRWSSGYFDISETGEVVARPQGAGTPHTVNLMDIVEGLRERAIKLPLLLRLSDVLQSRVVGLNEAFRQAIHDAGYGGAYRGVYPIKVNQQQHVVEEILKYGAPYHHGLEVGSKAELIAAMAYMQDPQALLICNGYKDIEFIQLGLYARKIGLDLIFVVEKVGELPLILECAERLDVKPRLGLRVKLASQGAGRWADSGGDLGIFGLNVSEAISLVDELKAQDKLDCLHLLHYHLGSQISNIRGIRSAAREATRIYVDLVKEGAPMGILDVGGGLAIDYDGSHTNFPSSRNYTLTEYCADIIEEVMAIADAAGVAHPDIVSESGRAVVAHHSVLIFDILDADRIDGQSGGGSKPQGGHEMVRDLAELAPQITARNCQEVLHDATYYRDEIRSLFMHGTIELRERAVAENLYWQIVRRVADAAQGLKHVPEELQNLQAAISDVYYGNFSVFQSLPDAWAIDQLFPIMPLHRLKEKPTRHGILSDITCDCDGKIDKFIDSHDIRRTLPLHEVNGRPYYLGVFLVGAYQETLGDLHNLMGDPNVIGVQMDEDGGIQYSCEIVGDSVADVLTYVEYDPKELVSKVRALAERAVRSGLITPSERRVVMDAYQSGLQGYTYLEKKHPA